MRLLVVCILSLLLFACKSKDKVPAGILPPAKMQTVLWDMISTGEFLNGFVFNRDTIGYIPETGRRWYEKVYQMHNISEEQFQKSYAYYREHPALIRPILDSLAKKTPPSVKPVPARIDTSAAGKSPLLTPSRSLKLDSLRKTRMLNRRPILDTNVK